MNDLDAIVGELFAKQSSVRSEIDYRSQVSQAAKQLFDRQPPGTGLPIVAFRAVIVSLLADYKLSLDDIKRRISRSAVS